MRLCLHSDSAKFFLNKSVQQNSLRSGTIQAPGLFHHRQQCQVPWVDDLYKYSCGSSKIFFLSELLLMSDPVTLWAFPQTNHCVKFGQYFSYIIATLFCPSVGRRLLGTYHTVSALNARFHQWWGKKVH